MTAERSSDQREALRYHPSKVEWATAQFLDVPPSLMARLFFYLLLLSIGAGVAYAWVAKVAVTVSAPGLLRPEQGVLPISAPITMSVKELLVRNNDEVEKGQLLLVSQDHLSDEEATQLVENAAALRELLAKDETFSCGECVARFERLAASAFVIQGSGPIREPLSALRQRLREMVSLRTLYAGRGASTIALQRRISLAQFKLEEIRKRNAEAMLASKVEELTSEIVAARSQIAERDESGKGNLRAARDRLVIQLGELDDTVERYRAQQTISAPIAGTVTELQVSGAGQLLVGGQRILEIVPKDSRLAAELHVANKDISQVRVGMEVRVRLAALPEREFGVATGKVESVAPNVSYDVKAASGGLPIYKVAVKLDQQSLTKEGVEHPFRLGMSFEGLVVSGYEPMLSLAIKRLLNLEDELL